MMMMMMMMMMMNDDDDDDDDESPNSFPAIGVLAGLVERLVVGPGCRAAAGRRVRGHICCYLHDLVTPTFKTPSLFDDFLLELHLS
jgi:hypothetical protein